MNELSQPGSLPLLRLIVELKGSDLPANAVFLLELCDSDPDVLADRLTDLQAAGLVSWSEQAQQWTPTMRGLAIGMALPAFDPSQTVAPRLEDSGTWAA